MEPIFNHKMDPIFTIIRTLEHLFLNPNQKLDLPDQSVNNKNNENKKNRKNKNNHIRILFWDELEMSSV